uniref:Uncharacterized protein n=1 Tax=Oryza glumipatula TaxID=40148 RepID=A0A0E0AAT0_9ORYZ
MVGKLRWKRRGKQSNFLGIELGQSSTTQRAIAPGLNNRSKRKSRSVYEAVTNDQRIQDITYNLTVDLMKEFFDMFLQIRSNNIIQSEGVDDIIRWRWTNNGIPVQSRHTTQFNGRLDSVTAKLIWKA